MSIRVEIEVDPTLDPVDPTRTEREIGQRLAADVARSLGNHEVVVRVLHAGSVLRQR